MGSEPEQTYSSFLVRIWRRESARTSAWQAMVEDPGTGTRRAFAELESLFDFLREQAGVMAVLPESRIPNDHGHTQAE
jgi:hypothetical protein